MAVDPRQVLSAFLTLSMFAMLSNMVRRDYFDYSEADFQGVSGVQIGLIKVEDKGTDSLPNGPWKEKGPELKPCWTMPDAVVENSTGYVTFSLTSGPGQHELQIANAVTVARFLGATLVLPEIRGKELGQRRRFGNVYDVAKFVSSLEGVVEVAAELPAEVVAPPPPVVRIPDGVSEAYISTHVEPVFRKNRSVRLTVFFPRLSPRTESNPGEMLGAVRCMSSYGALALTAEMQEVADAMVDRLRALGEGADGRFVAVDLRLDVLESNACGDDDSGERMSCRSPQEVGELLTKAGFDAGTTVYITQTWWHEELDSLKRIFPRTYTKDDIITPEKKRRILGSGGDDVGKALDLYVCSQSDAFLPAVADLFFSGNVAGKRDAAGRTQILAPDIALLRDSVALRCFC